MRIQHNIMAMNAYRNYNINTSAVSKNLEKLSSGYKINRAGDDAAGLAISEKMRAQITGLDAATKNVKDGISLVKTAEGAMQEIHDMLNRMDYLATQSANGTYDNDVDRANLQKEVESLKSEINRIADSANFNGIKLLDGSLNGGASLGATQAVEVTAVADGNQDGSDPQAGVYSLDLSDLKIYSKSGSTAVTVATFTIGGEALSANVTLAVNADGYATGKDLVTALAGSANGATSVAIGGISYVITYDAANGKITLTGQKAPTAAASIVDVKVSFTVGASDDMNNGWDQAVHVDKAPMILDSNKLAQGSFQLTTDMVRDGNQLTIGDNTYTFKVGKDSTVSGANVIDLSKYEEGDSNLLRYAADALSKANNSLFDVTTDRNVAGKIYLTEKPDKVDYTKDWDLKNTSGSTTDGKWNEAVTGGKRNSGVVTWNASTTGTGSSLSLQIGDTSDSFNQLKVNVGDMHTSAMGTKGGKSIADINIGSQTGAQEAVNVIRDAINYVSGVRGDLGATQNRLEHTQNNLSVMKENIQDAESTIRDTDIAEEMMAYTKNNILVQSAQAMLAQANQIPQGVLQLLG